MKKRKRFQCKPHMQLVSEMRCCVWGLSCNGMTQVHHLLKPWVGARGMGLRADDRNVVPLCQYHHQQLHDRYGDEFKFFESKTYEWSSVFLTANSHSPRRTSWMGLEIRNAMKMYTLLTE